MNKISLLVTDCDGFNEREREREIKHTNLLRFSHALLFTKISVGGQRAILDALFDKNGRQYANMNTATNCAKLITVCLASYES